MRLVDSSLRRHWRQTPSESNTIRRTFSQSDSWSLSTWPREGATHGSRSAPRPGLVPGGVAQCSRRHGTQTLATSEPNIARQTAATHCCSRSVPTAHPTSNSLSVVSYLSSFGVTQNWRNKENSAVAINSTFCNKQQHRPYYCRDDIPRPCAIKTVETCSTLSKSSLFLKKYIVQQMHLDGSQSHWTLWSESILLSDKMVDSVVANQVHRSWESLPLNQFHWIHECVSHADLCLVWRCL